MEFKGDGHVRTCECPVRLSAVRTSRHSIICKRD